MLGCWESRWPLAPGRRRIGKRRARARPRSTKPASNAASRRASSSLRRRRCRSRRGRSRAEGCRATRSVHCKTSTTSRSACARKGTARSAKAPLFLLELRGAEQAPLALGVAQVEGVVALAALRLVAHAQLLAPQPLVFEALHHGDVAAVPGLRVLPAHRLVVGRLVQRLARVVEEQAQVLVVE